MAAYMDTQSALAAWRSALSTDGVAVSSSKLAIFPGFCDVHVHFREPGFLLKETMQTGCASAAAGGYTAVCTMPNLDPVPDSPENMAVEQRAIEKDATIAVYPYAAITIGEKGEQLVDMEALAASAIAYSDDGRGVQSREMMKEAMLRAKAMGKLIAAHCEDNSLLRGGYIHDGEYAKAHGHKGICSESEWGPIARDLELVRETGCSYHVCHISTKESVELIRKAKQEGLDVTCETGPHYLVMDDSMLQEDGRFKMNPPLRSAEDREALVAGLLDGTIDMIATDHAPHTAAEKGKGLSGSAFGVVGLETAFAVMYTHFVKPGIITMDKLMDLMVFTPRKRFGIPLDSGDYTLWDLDAEYTVDPETFHSKGHATPFTGAKLFGRCKRTVKSGRTVYED